MRYNLLGRTGLYVSELCLGAMTFGGKGFWQVIGKLGDQGGRGARRHRARRRRQLHRHRRRLLGGRVARSSSAARSRRSGGRASRSSSPPRCAAASGRASTRSGLSRGAHPRRASTRASSRLGLDHVDLYQIHGFDPVTPIEETVRALDDVVRSGKARYVGFSNLPAWLAMKALAFADANGLARFQSAQMYYSIAGRDIEREIVADGAGRGRRDPAVEPARRRPPVRQVRSRTRRARADARRASFDFPPVDQERLPRVLAALRDGRRGDAASRSRASRSRGSSRARS